MFMVAESLDSAMFCMRAPAWKGKTGGQTKGVNGGLCTSWGNCVGKDDRVSSCVEKTFAEVSSTSTLVSSCLMFSPGIVLATCAKRWFEQERARGSHFMSLFSEKAYQDPRY